MQSTSDDEKLIQCPYDKSHMIIHYRMQTHLVKCRRNHIASKMIECPYNFVHKVPEPELAYHINNCVDRRQLDKFVYATDVTETEVPIIPEINIPADENWDDECSPTYNALEVSKTKAVIRSSNQTLSGAQRRNFRQEERQRMNELTANSTVARDNLRSAQMEAPSNRPENMPRNERLMDAIKRGSHNLSTPRVGTSSDENSAPILSEADYPPLGATNKPRENLWNASSLAEKNKPRGRGRGFVQY